MDREPLLVTPLAVSVVLAVLAAGFGVAGCTPNIGDRCSVSTDCSVRGDRVCDTSQPNGYCTLFNCTSNSCPNNAACVEFSASVPGCPYDDYRSPSRTGRTFCMATCASDSDCRQGDGYVCRSPSASPWSAVVLDSNSSRRICVVAPRWTPLASSADAAVCTTGSPTSLASLADANVVGSDGDSGPESGVNGSDAAGSPPGPADGTLNGGGDDASVNAPESSADPEGGALDSGDAFGDGAAGADVSDGPVGG